MSTAKRWAYLILLLAGTGCPRSTLDEPPADGPTVDAWVYAHGFCAAKCYRLSECALEPDREACSEACIDDALQALSGDPCWAEWVEVRRCTVNNAACEEIADEVVTSETESACARHNERLSSCENQ